MYRQILKDIYTKDHTPQSACTFKPRDLPTHLKFYAQRVHKPCRIPTGFKKHQNYIVHTSWHFEFCKLKHPYKPVFFFLNRSAWCWRNSLLLPPQHLLTVARHAVLEWQILMTDYKLSFCQVVPRGQRICTLNHLFYTNEVGRYVHIHPTFWR